MEKMTSIKEEKLLKDDIPKSVSKEKKRRRTIKTEVRSTSPSEQKKTRLDSIDKFGRQLFYYEENHVEGRDANADVLMQKAACQEVQRAITEIQELKKEGGNAEKLQALQIHGTLQFITLKKLNRIGHFRCKKVREKTNESKMQIDVQHLKLQNLLYEVMHLQKEITKCLQFKSTDEDVSLVDVDEFYSSAPADISKPEVTKSDIHQQTLARLDWELEQRKSLSEKLTSATSKKDDIETEIKAKKDYLESLQPKLNSILQATKPVQEYLGMPFDEVREQQATAAYLPRPLYVLYMQTTAYRDACNKQLTVSIQGDADVARAMEGSTIDLEDDSDSETEEQEKSKEKRRRKKSRDDKFSDKKQKLLKKHPLSIYMIINCIDGHKLKLTFYYLVSLHIVTVTVKLSSGPDAGPSTISGGDLLAADQVLSCLYPSDLGQDTPNPSNTYALQRIGLGKFDEYVSEVGFPYQWVQWLCGLQFLTLSPSPSENDSLADKPCSTPHAKADVSAGHMEATINKLRRRIQARLSLQKQLGGLERCVVAVSIDDLALYPAKICSHLTQWKRTTYEDFVVLPFTKKLVSTGLATSCHMYFMGVAERGSVKMSVHCIISPDYPDSAPLFALNIHWRRDRNAQNDDSMREMEAEVNLHYGELIRDNPHDQLLTNQMQRLLMCMDVYLESEAEQAGTEGPNEFAREKMFPRIARGPNRSKPYVYNPQLGFFSQR